MSDGPGAPRRPARILQATRRRWPWVVGVPGATVILALLFIFLVPPLFESRSTLRFIESQSPLGGALSSLAGGGGGAGGLSLLASFAGQGVPIQTEMEVLGSRELARVVMDELGLRLQVEDPSRVLRDRVFTEVAVGPDTPEGDYELVAGGDGSFRLSGEVVVGRDPFRPVFNEETEEVELGEVAPGRPLPLEGSRIVLAPGAGDFRRIRFRIHAPQEALEEFRDAIGVDRPARDADILAVGVRWSDPVLATRATDLLAQRFIERREAFLAREYGRTATFLAGELDSLRTELGRAEEELRAYREAEGIVEPEAQATAAVEQLAELQARRDLVSAEREALLALLRRARSGEDAEGSGESPYRRLVYFPTLLTSSATAELVTLLGELENERAALMDRRTTEAREVRALTDRIEGVEAQLRTVAETYLEGLEEQVVSLDQLLSGFRGQLESVPATELEYLRRRRQVELLNELYLFMEMRRKEAEVTAAGETGGVRVVDGAELPLEPARPRPLLTLILALVAGVGLGVGTAVLLEYTTSSDGRELAQSEP